MLQAEIKALYGEVHPLLSTARFVVKKYRGLIVSVANLPPCTALANIHGHST